MCFKFFKLFFDVRKLLFYFKKLKIWSVKRLVKYIKCKSDISKV